MVSKWESKGLSNENFKPCYISNRGYPPKLIWNGSRITLKFEGSCLRQEDKAPFTPNNIVNLFMVFALDRWSRDLNTDFILKDCLFGAVKITKNVNPEKYLYPFCPH